LVRRCADHPIWPDHKRGRCPARHHVWCRVRVGHTPGLLAGHQMVVAGIDLEPGNIGAIRRGWLRVFPLSSWLLVIGQAMCFTIFRQGSGATSRHGEMVQRFVALPRERRWIQREPTGGTGCAGPVLRKHALRRGPSVRVSQECFGRRRGAAGSVGGDGGGFCGVAAGG
jgi:hypothetical protein